MTSKWWAYQKALKPARWCSGDGSFTTLLRKECVARVKEKDMINIRRIPVHPGMLVNKIGHVG